MEAEQSQFSKVPKKMLFNIAKFLLEKDRKVWTADNPYDNFDTLYTELYNVSKYFGITAVQEDVEFFCKFIEINERYVEAILENDKTIIDFLDIPVAQKYRLEYNVWGNCNYTEYLYQDFSSYDESWVSSSADQQYADGNWDLYDGVSLRDIEYDDCQTSDMGWGDVYEVPEKQRESLLSKLVIENTEEVVDSLDKETLMKLKSVINSRLRLL